MAVKHIRLWTGFGTFLSVAAAGPATAATVFDDRHAPMMLAQGVDAYGKFGGKARISNGCQRTTVFSTGVLAGVFNKICTL